MAKKKSIFAVFWSVIGVAAVSLALLACSVKVTDNGKPNNGNGGSNVNPYAVTLSAPKNVSFNKDNFKLSWDAVDKASGYQINHNGTIIEVGEETSKTFKTAELTENNTFKVKAMGDGFLYLDSEWSESVSFVNKQADFGKMTVYEKVTEILRQTAEANKMEFVEVIGISYADPSQPEGLTNITFETLCNVDGVNRNVRLGYSINDYNSTGELLNNFEYATLKGYQTFNTVDYNSAQKLLDSGSYDGEMQNLADEGYELSVVSSCVREGKELDDFKFVFEVVGTYKAVKGNDVKYFTSVNKINIHNCSSVDVNNYENSVKVASRRDVTETACVMHKDGGTLEYISDWAAKYDKTN